MHFVVIGGDAAGMSAASRARRNDPSIDVTVLEKTSDVSYSACGMPYNIADSRRPIEDLVVRHAETFREKQGIQLLTGHEAKAINRTKKTVSGTSDSGDDFSLSYDKLLIATGASPVLPDIPGIDLPGVFCLKSLEDGRKIKRYLDQHKVQRVIMIGMGYIALEMAEAFKERQIDVEMIKPRPRFLPWMNEELAAIVRQELDDHEVKLHLGHTIEAICADTTGGSPLMLKSSSGEPTGDLVLAAIGVSPNSRMAEEAGLGLGPEKAIAVDQTMKTTDEDIYAAGDCADAYHVLTGDKVFVPLALRANRGGWAVADNVCGRENRVPGILGTAVFKVFDLEVARTGLNRDQAKAHGFDAEEVYIKSRSRAHAHPGSTTLHISMVADRRSGKLLGAQMVGREGAAHRINSVVAALHSGMTVSQFADSDFAYAPPFSPVWDPLLTSANQLLKKIRR